MGLAKCERCDKLFSKVVSPICSACTPMEEDEFDKIRNVIYDEPSLNVKEIAQLAEVEVSVVLRMLDEGLITNVDLGDAVKCGKCGAPAISVSSS